MPKFHDRRPVTLAEQFDGTTDSVDLMVTLLKQDFDFTIEKKDFRKMLTIVGENMVFILQEGDWLTSRRDETGTTWAVVTNMDFKRRCEPVPE
jgi:hypothetical protein